VGVNKKVGGEAADEFSSTSVHDGQVTEIMARQNLGDANHEPNFERLQSPRNPVPKTILKNHQGCKRKKNKKQEGKRAQFPHQGKAGVFPRPTSTPMPRTGVEKKKKRALWGPIGRGNRGAPPENSVTEKKGPIPERREGAPIIA